MHAVFAISRARARGEKTCFFDVFEKRHNINRHTEASSDRLLDVFGKLTTLIEMVRTWLQQDSMLQRLI
jgi:hypothetical protein